MSDTPAELSDFRHILYRCKGHVLINGLGLGIVADAVLSREGVDHVTVIEVSSDVIALTGPTLEARYGDKLTIVNADALAWKSPRGIRYNVVWHDIWDTICGDNKETMSKLHRKYGRRCDWQDSWCRDSVMNR